MRGREREAPKTSPLPQTWGGCVCTQRAAQKRTFEPLHQHIPALAEEQKLLVGDVILVVGCTNADAVGAGNAVLGDLHNGLVAVLAIGVLLVVCESRVRLRQKG